MTTWVNVNSRRQTRASRVSHIMHIETDTLTDSCMHKQVGIFIFICYACIYIIPFFYMNSLANGNDIATRKYILFAN